MQCPSETEGGAITGGAESRSTNGVIGGNAAGRCAADKGKGGEESGLVPHRCFVLRAWRALWLIAKRWKHEIGLSGAID